MNKLKSKRKIKITGAGLAGLAAGITLQKEGYQVTIYEQSQKGNSIFNNDFQGFPNWITDDDILASLERMGLKIDVDYKPFIQSSFYGPALDKKVEFKSQEPLFYLVERGLAEGCFDKALRERFIENGGEIEFDSSFDSNDVDIIATGSDKVKAVGSGYTFNTNYKDIACAVIDDDLAPKGYAYLLVNNGYGTMATVLFEDFGEHNKYLQRTFKAFRKKLGIQFQNKEKFSGYGDFAINKKVYKNGTMLAGEAAGFQDYFLGFGMFFALKSGYLAAKSIIKDLNYDKLCNREFGDLLKGSLSNRFIFEMVGCRPMYNVLIEKVRPRKNEPVEVMKDVYAHDWKSRLIYPLARLFSLLTRI